MSEALLAIDYEDGPSFRVLGDGRVEFRSDVEPGLDSEGRVVVRPVTPEWREQWRFSADELEQVRRAVAEADEPPLEPVYGNEVPGRRMQNVRWRLDTGSRTADVTVIGYPVVRVPALESLFQRLYRIHRVPGETTVWRLSTPAGMVEKLVPCEASGVPILRPLYGALFGRPLGARSEAEGAPEGDVLVEVTFRREGEEVDRSIVLVDGRFFELRDGAYRERARLETEQVEAVRRALSDVDWTALPARLC